MRVSGPQRRAGLPLQTTRLPLGDLQVARVGDDLTGREHRQVVILLLSGLFGGEAREAHLDFRAHAVARARARQMI